MRFLKGFVVVLLVLWLAFITWRIEQIRYLALYACGLSYAQAETDDLKHGRHPPAHPRECPYIDFFVPYPPEPAHSK
jgi:hypothetical protein